jgi:hypothetical protein
MQHADFVRDYRNGALKLSVDTKCALRTCELDPRVPGGMRLSLRFWHNLESVLVIAGVLSLLVLPWYFSLTMVVLGLCLKPGTHSTAEAYVVELALRDSRFYNDMLSSSVLQVEPRLSTLAPAPQPHFRPRSIL